MLVLSRTRDQTIMIGDDVEITIVDVRGDKVRLGITAPAHIPVHRKEVYDAIKRENASAAQMNPGDLTGKTPGPQGGAGPQPKEEPRDDSPDKKDNDGTKKDAGSGKHKTEEPDKREGS